MAVVIPCGCLTTVSASAFSLPSPLCVSNLPLRFSYKDTCHWISAHPGNSRWSHLEILSVILFAKNFFSNKATFTGSRDLMWVYPFGDPIQPTEEGQGPRPNNDLAGGGVSRENRVSKIPFSPCCCIWPHALSPSSARHPLWSWIPDPLLDPAPLTQMCSHLPPSKAFTFWLKNYLLTFTKVWDPFFTRWRMCNIYLRLWVSEFVFVCVCVFKDCPFAANDLGDQHLPYVCRLIGILCPCAQASSGNICIYRSR